MERIKEIIQSKINTKYKKTFKELYTWKDISKKVLVMLLIIFIIDYLNIFTKLINRREFIFVYIIVTLLGLIKILEFKPWNLYKLKTVNYVDSFLISSIITLFIYDIIILTVNLNVTLKITICTLLIIILSRLELNRILKINKTERKDTHTNVYDLKDLYDGNIQTEKSLILIR
mgnify:CR=1 FL=1